MHRRPSHSGSKRRIREARAGFGPRNYQADSIRAKISRPTVKPRTFMLIAGEASGDFNAAELVNALRREFVAAPAITTSDYQPLYTSLETKFFGAGGPRMAAAGVDIAFDLTQHSVIGVSDVLRKYLEFRRLFYQLFRLALDRQPDCIICVDFFGFNGRFLHAIRRHIR